MRHTLLLITILFFLMVNYVALLTSPLMGLLVASVGVILFLLLAFLDAYDLYAEDILCLVTTFPLLLITALVLHFTDPFLNAHVVYIFLLLIDIVYIFHQYGKKDMFQFGKLKYLAFTFFFLLLAVTIGNMIYVAYIPGGNIPLVSLVLFILLGACAEELFFRFLIQKAAIQLTETGMGIIFTTILYLLFHASSNIPLLMVFLLLSVFSSVLFRLSKNIYLSIIFNIAINVAFYMFTGSILSLSR